MNTGRTSSVHFVVHLVVSGTTVVYKTHRVSPRAAVTIESKNENPSYVPLDERFRGVNVRVAQGRERAGAASPTQRNLRAHVPQIPEGSVEHMPTFTCR